MISPPIPLVPNSILSQSLSRNRALRYHAKFNDTIHTPGDTRGQSLSPVTPKQTFLYDIKPWSSLEPNAIRYCSILECIMTLRCIIGLGSFNRERDGERERERERERGGRGGEGERGRGGEGERERGREGRNRDFRQIFHGFVILDASAWNWKPPQGPKWTQISAMSHWQSFTRSDRSIIFLLQDRKDQEGTRIYSESRPPSDSNL